jgi:hypothetical protein
MGSFWCWKCRKNTSHRMLLHTTPIKTMCYECGEFGEYKAPTVPSVRPQQASSTKQHPSCQRCYSGAALAVTVSLEPASNEINHLTLHNPLRNSLSPRLRSPACMLRGSEGAHSWQSVTPRRAIYRE